MNKETKLTSPFDSPPPHYQPQQMYDKITQERDVMVPMRDGVHFNPAKKGPRPPK